MTEMSCFLSCGKQRSRREKMAIMMARSLNCSNEHCECVSQTAALIIFSLCNDTRCGNEQEALQLARRMRRAPVTLPSSIATHPVDTNYVRVEPVTGDDGGPILLLHGFDSSLLEWRRLIPELEKMGADAYAMDVLGWGFTGSEGVTSFGAGKVCCGGFIHTAQVSEICTIF